MAENKLAALEGAPDCLHFASGMGAMTTVLFAMLAHGTHVVVTDDVVDACAIPHGGGGAAGPVKERIWHSVS